MVKDILGPQHRKIVNLVMIGVAIAGLMAILLPQLFAQAAVTNVAIVDNDTMGYGLDGRDFRVTWTPGSEPAGYQFTQVYIVPSSTVLTVANLSSVCTGSPENICQPAGFFNQHSLADFILPQFSIKDSNSQAWVTSTDYVAWIYVSSTVPAIVSSSPVSYANAFDIPVDIMAPQIDHMPVHGAVAAVNAVISTMVFDDQTIDSHFANLTDDGNEYLSLYYGSNVAVSATVTSGVQVAGSLFKFTVPAAEVPNAGGTFQYYIIARDRAGNARFVCSNPSANSTSSCQSSPFVVNTVAQGSRSVAGTLSNNGVGVSGAKVFPAGFALNATTTDASGNYILQGLPNNDAFDFTGFKPGYCRNSRFETLSTVNKTGINFNLNEGSCGFFSGGGGGSIGGGGSPIVMFSGPPENSNNIPQNEKIRVGLSQPMSASTINDNNAADAGSNSYLTTDDGTTKIAGSVVYCENSSAAGCSTLPSQDANVILFIPATNLTINTFYTFVITEKVTNQGGQSIQGNRPGGGHNISFTTGGGTFSAGQFTLGTSGQFMPPYVRSMVPAPGVIAAPNIKFIIEFDQAMDSATINTANVNLVDRTTGNSAVSLSSVSLDSNEKRFAVITPASALTSGDEYELRIKGAVANSSGITMRPPDQASLIAFSSFFRVSGSNDATAPTIYPLITNNATNVAVNIKFDFGFSEQLDFNTIDSTNITFSRAGTSVGINTDYDSGKNNLTIIPASVLAPNTAYTLVLGSGVKDLAGNRIATGTYTYTTGAADSTAPTISEARCDDYTCSIAFSEPMNNDAQVDINWVSSTVNHQNITLTQGGADKVIMSSVISYDAGRNAIMLQGVNLDKTSGVSFTLSIVGVTDLSGNVLSTQSIVGPVEDSTKTFGSFSGDGMFAPPTSDFTGSIGGGEFKPQGFGSFTAEQFALGQADRAFPFNPTASQDANVFQVQFSPGVVLQNGDTVQLTFPNGTDVTNAALDTLSPMNKDMNMQGGGTITGTGVAVSASANTVTVTLGVSGTTGVGDSYTVDLRKITNPSIPKDPTTGGYTVGIKLSRSGSVLANRTTMPYFIKSAGTNNVTIRVYADSAVSPTNVAGTVQLFAGGPSGAMNKTLTLTAGSISAVDGVVGTEVAYTGLSDGCYFFGTEPSVTLNSIDYFGQMSPEPICVSGGVSQTKNFILTASTGSGSVTTTIKLAGIANFGGIDMDIFAGGPGRFVVKTLTAVGAPNANGYTLKLPANGMWSIGIGPSMPKGSSGGIPTQLPGVPPAPIMVNVAGLGTDTPTISLANSFQSPGAALATNSTTITFTFATADKTITGNVTDGSTGLQSVNIFLHRQGFGAPVFGTTNALGTFSLAVSDYGSYMIGASKDGLPPAEQQIEVRVDGVDAGSDPDIYFQGKQITDANPLVITLKKADYTISGKVLDASGNGVGYASVFGVNASNGQIISGRSSGDGSYSLFVGAGVWNLRSELPPDKSDTCGTLSLAVTITTESKSSQNISPSASTCYTLSGTVSVGGSNLANAPLFVQEWDTINSRPVAGGSQRGTMTNSVGAYSMKVAGNKTYRIGTWHSDYGELSATKAVTGDTSQNITVATVASTDFIFTGGSSVMNSMVELKNASDSTKVIRKQKTGLDTGLSINTESGATYNYFIDVPGIGKFTGSAAAGSAMTVALGITSSDFVTVTGTIKNNSGDTLVGALVMFSNTSTSVVQTASTDANGQYSINVKSGNYAVSSNLAGYVPGEAAQTTSFTVSTTGYDFGGASPDQTALQAAGKSIEGTIRDSSGQPMTNGYVWAENSAGLVVSGAVNASNGTYSLPVTAGTWTVSAVGPKHAKTSKSGTVTISSSNSTGNTITLTADSTRVPTSTSGIITANAGGSINDSAGSGIKLTAGSGVLETGSSNITLNLEKNYTAPETQTFTPLANTAFKISASGDSAIKNLNGNAEIQLSYSDLVSSIPSGTSESDLKLMYLSPETGDYIPVEGGFTVDTANNTITGLVNHFTDFVIAYVPPAESVAAPAPAGNSIVASGGGGGFSLTVPIVTTTTPAVSTVIVPVPVSTTPAASVISVSNPASAISMLVSKTTYTTQQKASFNYTFTFNGKKAAVVRIVRQTLNSKGKVVLTSSATKKLKPNGKFSAKVNQPLTRLAPGNYTMRVQVFGPKLLDQNSFSFTVSQPKKKYLTFGEAVVADNFTLKMTVPKSPVALPYRLVGRYSYVNTTDRKQQITMVRELISATGKAVEKKTGVWTLKPGKSDSVAFKTQIASNVQLGTYTLRITAYDRVTKKQLHQVTLPLEVAEK